MLTKMVSSDSLHIFLMILQLWHLYMDTYTYLQVIQHTMYPQHSNNNFQHSQNALIFFMCYLTSCAFP